MPKDPAKPEVLDEEILEGEIEVPDDDEVPIDKDKEVNVDEEDKLDEEFKKLDNKAFAKLRKEASDAKKERDDFKKKVDQYEKDKKGADPVVRQPVERTDERRRETIGGIIVPETKEEWDALARKDWKAAVDLRSIINIRNANAESRRVDLHARTLEDSKNRVAERHPELLDVNTEKSQIYVKILEKNPDYLTMPKGPILAMRDMEDELEVLGYTREQIYNPKKVATQEEATRVTRGALTGGGRMPEKTGRTVTLTKDELELCKSQGIDPKDFAREKLQLENRTK